MSVETILSSSLWRLVSWLPGIILRQIFRKNTLSDLTKIDVKPRNDSTAIYCGEMPNARVWIEIRNRSPFNIELDRLTAYVMVNTSICTIRYLNRISIGPNSDMELEISDDMSAPQAYQLLNYIKREQLSGNPIHVYGALSINADFNCRISNFSIRNRHLSGVTYRITNPHISPLPYIEAELHKARNEQA